MLGVPPHNCSICYQSYNNERSPLILITCGHTFCKECLEMIFLNDSKEIPCPECKQSTYISEPKALPKNRSLLNFIIYHEELKQNKNNIPQQSENQNQNEMEEKVTNLLCDYSNILNKLDETYNKILEEHSYLNEISDVLIIREVDEVLDNLIEIINDYRTSLHKKIKTEFQKVNLIKDFKSSLNMYRTKLNMYTERITQIGVQIDPKENLCENENNFGNSHDEIKQNLDLKLNEEFILTQSEIENLQNEIKFAELYSLTFKHYSKEIYNPCKYFFLNKFQIEKLTDDIKKLLQKVCDFDENVFKFNLEKLNINDEKKLIKEIQEACNQSNYKKLKFIFTHLRINPNFIYSDVLDHLTYQSVSDRDGVTGNSKIYFK